MMKQDQIVEVKQIKGNMGKVFARNGEFITKIRIDAEKRKPKVVTYNNRKKTHENSASVIDSKGNYIQDVYISDTEDSDDDDSWEGYRLTLHSRS